MNNGGSTENVPAKTFINYDQNIIPKASDFYCAVIKFEIPLQSLPLFVMPIVPNQVNPNLTTLQVGICEVTPNLPGNNPPLTPQFIENVIWETQNYNIPVPIQDQNFQVVTPYYYDYSYEHFVYLINKALALAWVAGGSIGGHAPYFFYDVQTKIINLIMTKAFQDNATHPSTTGLGWTVCVNGNLNYYMQSFDYHKHTIPNRYEISVKDLATNKSYWAPSPYGTTTVAGTDTYLIQQEYPSNDYINSVRKIILITNNIPVRKENFPAPNIAQTGLTSFLGIMSDFNLDNNNIAGAQRSTAIYSAQVYNLIDMITEIPVRQVDLQIFWADNNNNLYPVTLGPNDVANIKLGFFSKSLYDNNPANYRR